MKRERRRDVEGERIIMVEKKGKNRQERVDKFLSKAEDRGGVRILKLGEKKITTQWTMNFLYRKRLLLF